jgi:hypothetical protein
VYTAVANAVADSRRTNNRLERGDLAGGVVRLVAHDAFGFDRNVNNGLGSDGTVLFLGYDFAIEDDIGFYGCLLEASIHSIQ